MNLYIIFIILYKCNSFETLDNATMHNLRPIYLTFNTYIINCRHFENILPFYSILVPLFDK